MTPLRVLVVEDDASLAAGLVRGLRSAGFEVELLTSGADVVRRVLADRFDVIVLDLMLPEKDGFTVLAQLRDRGSPPIIVLTARTDLADRLRSFTLGAADYVSKPFFTDELVLRIRARFRGIAMEPRQVIRFGYVEIDLPARSVTVGGSPVALTPTETDILVYLASRPDRAISRQQLCDSVLRSLEGGDARTVDAHVARLRKKLGPDASFIVTVWGIGYRFRGDDGDAS